MGTRASQAEIGVCMGPSTGRGALAEVWEYHPCALKIFEMV